MFVEIDFQSEEAIYRQLYRQIIMGIATRDISLGDSLPSVRDMAEQIGINMHTVNKTYTILKEEGYLTMDRRRGAVVSLNPTRTGAEEELCEALKLALAKASVRKIPPDRVHELVDQIFEEYL